MLCVYLYGFDFCFFINQNKRLSSTHTAGAEKPVHRKKKI